MVTVKEPFPELENPEAWTEIDGDLAGIDPKRAEMIKKSREGTARFDAVRAAHWQDPDGVDAFVDIPYMDDDVRGHKLDVYVPHDARLRADHTMPIYVDVHGGGFIYGYKELNRNYCTHLAAHGVVVVSLSYRPAPQTDFQGQLQDVANGLKWVKENMMMYPGDPSHVFLTGDSAGGCLAFYATLVEHNPEFARKIGVTAAGLPVTGSAIVSAIVDLTPYLDPAVQRAHNVDDLSAMLGKDFFSCLAPVGVENLTLNKLVADLNVPPLYLLTSSDDFIEAETLKLATAMSLARKKFELHDFAPEPGRALGHVFSIGMSWLEESQEVFEQMRKFAYHNL